MCDNHEHKHTAVEEWVTPEGSKHLSAKMVQLWPGEHIHPHTTGKDREEVLVCIYGTIHVSVAGKDHVVSSGQALFIPENTWHGVVNLDEGPAQYCYVVTKKKPASPYGGLTDPETQYHNDTEQLEAVKKGMYELTQVAE